jgi:protein-S-isoprenylcysteine O-methyltransferase Ste14
MYTGIIGLFLALGPALASAWALVPGVLIGALFVVRTAREDRMLREELPGYADYARRVPWRLIPGIW